TDLQGNLFAAAAHTGKTELANNLNQIRLGTENNYFNSGVLLMDLDQARRTVSPEEIFTFTGKHQRELLLPDQDILNAMFGSRTLELDDALWNYDARDYHTYLFRSGGEYDLDWVMSHTAILHFCGKSKPWQAGYHYRFGVLYKHYLQLTRRWTSLQAPPPET
ncbi:MAG: glycosyltransferase family 8 protein, partial [Acutalibacter sp.]